MINLIGNTVIYRNGRPVNEGSPMNYIYLILLLSGAIYCWLSN